MRYLRAKRRAARWIVGLPRLIRHAWDMLLQAYTRFIDDDGDLLAGGIAFFAVLSLAPTLVIALALASTVLGGEAVSGVLVSELRPALGDTAAAFVAEVIAQTHRSGASGLAAFLGSAVTIYASTRVFTQIQTALNRVWGVEAQDPTGLRQRAVDLVKKRLVSFGLVLGLGLLLAVVIFTKSALYYLAVSLHLPAVPMLWRLTDLALSFTALVGILASVYRMLPDARIAWKDALRGGLLTAACLAVGAVVIGIYFDYVRVESAFGAAGSLVVFMLSAYYGAQIFLFGAELTEAVAHPRRARSTQPPRPG